MILMIFFSICVIQNLWWQSLQQLNNVQRKQHVIPFFCFTEFNIIELNRNKGCASYSMGWLHY